LNEPGTFSASAYLLGTRPPGKRNFYKYLKVNSKMAAAHKLAYNILKTGSKDKMIGIAKDLIYFEAYKNKPFNKLIKSFWDWFFNYNFLDKLNASQDFIGINYYFHNRINYGMHKFHNPEVSDMGWGLYPEATYYLLKEVSRYGKPIIITEHGLADADDKHRAKYIEETLNQVNRALKEGIDVRGYLHWSLLDNFEWDYGYWPRFGLAEVDYKTLKRTPRKSSGHFRKLIEMYSGKSK
jgi:beta-glucosidase